MTVTKSVVLLLAAVPKVLCANTSVPIAKPKFVRAPATVVAPVPPFAIGTAPERVVASAGIVIFVVPSKATPLIVLAVCSLEEEAALPVVFWFNVGKFVRFAALPVGVK